MSFTRMINKSASLSGAAKRIEELLKLTAPIGVDIIFSVKHAYVDDQYDDPKQSADAKEPLVRIMVHNKNVKVSPKGTLADDPVGVGIAKKLRSTAERLGLTIVPYDDSYAQQDMLLPRTDAFALAFAYLRECKMSDATLAPVEKMVQDALAAEEHPKPGKSSLGDTPSAVR